MSSPQTTASDLAAVADAIRDHDRFVVTTHENPDGDALGSLLASKLALEQLGKDTVMVLHGDAPLPNEYAFMQLGDLQRRWPDDVSERVLLAVDCANESRIADPEVLGRVPLSIDVDHHHDNTRFGRINLIVADASSTGEVLRDLFRELNVEHRAHADKRAEADVRIASPIQDRGADGAALAQESYVSLSRH